MDQTQTPVLRETRHDRTTAGLLSIFCGLAAVVILLGAVALQGRAVEPAEPIVLIEYIELSSEEIGPPAEAPELESVDEPLASELAEQGGMTETLTTVTDLQADVSPLAVRQFESFTPSSTESQPDDSDGSGAASGELSPGGSALCGLPPEERWFIKFDESSLDEYARQIDFFGIEIGAFLPARDQRPARLIFLSNVSQPEPVVRELEGKTDPRLYLNWQRGKYSARDRALFRDAGVDVSGAAFLLFLNADTEQQLLQAEKAWRGKEPHVIRRTYFRVVADGDGYRFKVTSQSYLR